MSSISEILLQTRGRRTFVHTEDGRERLLGMVERSVPVIEYADAVPELGIFLRLCQFMPAEHDVTRTFGFGRLYRAC